jgi:hypothetical protein
MEKRATIQPRTPAGISPVVVAATTDQNSVADVGGHRVIVPSAQRPAG